MPGTVRHSGSLEVTRGIGRGDRDSDLLRRSDLTVGQAGGGGLAGEDRVHASALLRRRAAFLTRYPTISSALPPGEPPTVARLAERFHGRYKPESQAGNF